MKDSARTAREPHTLIFLHLHKTAGQTWIPVSNRNYDKSEIYNIDGLRLPKSVEEFCELSQEVKREVRCLRGHIGFGIHESIEHPCSYATIMREPVDRVISHYYYLLERPDDPLHRRIKDLTLEEYAARSDNMQTRYLSGFGEEDTFFDEPCPAEMLEKAKSNLRIHFTVVGLQDRFDESLILFRRILKWRSMNLAYASHNVTRRRPRRDEVRADTIAEIARLNHLDMKLYDEGRKVFSEQLGRQGFSFNVELAALRLLNSVFQPIYRISSLRKLGRRIKNRVRPQGPRIDERLINH